MAFGSKTAKIQDLETAIGSYKDELEHLINEISRLNEESEDDYCPNFYVVTPTKGKPFTVVADGVCFTDGHYTFFDEFPCGHTQTVALYPHGSVKSIVEEGAIYAPKPPVKPAKPAKEAPAPKPAKTSKKATSV